ncbi:MAG: hypothetical protein CMP47_11490 [Rickettsiales bacterium]|nr:hypothetical protein [Rickettsiales bacterium]
MFARPDSVLRILENRDVMAEGRLASCGAMMGGRLNEANIVMLSRMANNAYDSLGTTAAEDDDGAPNIRAKHESLYTHRLMFTDDIAKNFVGPGETEDACLQVRVDVRVSTVLAVMYVEKYRPKIRRKGLEKRNACGRVMAGRSERRRHDERDAPLATFSTIERSITHITGAIKADALAADVRSAPSLKPRLAVFHCSSFSGSIEGFRRVDRGM